MSDQYFDVASLAAYLHVTPQQIERLASRDKLPCRRVSGQYLFSRAEIHHWMEARIGLLDDEGLAGMEDQLNPAGHHLSVVLIDLLPLAAVAIPLTARTRSSVIVAMANLAANTGLLWDPEKMADAVRAREELHSTALDNGVALLHPRRPLASILAEPLLALGISPQGIPFGCSGQLTDIFWLICSTDERTHLRVLARLSRLIGQEEFLTALRSAETAAEARQAVADFEIEIDPS